MPRPVSVDLVLVVLVPHAWGQLEDWKKQRNSIRRQRPRAMLETPWLLKLSDFGPRQYLDGWPLVDAWCCSEIKLRSFAGAFQPCRWGWVNSFKVHWIWESFDCVQDWFLAINTNMYSWVLAIWMGPDYVSKLRTSYVRWSWVKLSPCQGFHQGISAKTTFIVMICEHDCS